MREIHFSLLVVTMTTIKWSDMIQLGGERILATSKLDEDFMVVSSMKTTLEHRSVCPFYKPTFTPTTFYVLRFTLYAEVLTPTMMKLTPVK